MEDWNNRATSQEIPKIAVKLPEARERHEWLPHRFQRECGPVHTWISDSHHLELWDNTFLLFQSTSLWRLATVALANETPAKAFTKLRMSDPLASGFMWPGGICAGDNTTAWLTAKVAGLFLRNSPHPWPSSQSSQFQESGTPISSLMFHRRIYSRPFNLISIDWITKYWIFSHLFTHYLKTSTSFWFLISSFA